MNIRAIEQRRSIRKFRNESVPEDALKAMLEAARLAPSAKNNQPWKFLVLGPESRERALNAMDESLRASMADPESLFSRGMLAGAVHTLRAMRSAPVLIFVVRPGGSRPMEASEGVERVNDLLDAMSVGAAVENMLLEAETHGLGTLWIGNTFLTYDDLCAALRIEGQLLGAIAVGVPDEAPAPRPRKRPEEIVEYLP